eukprot:gene27546-33983_t
MVVVIEEKPPTKEELLLRSVLERKAATVQELLNEGASADTCDPLDERPVLHLACEAGAKEIVAALLKAGAEVNNQNTGHHEVVESLLMGDADPNAVNKYSLETPLHWASARGHAAAAKVLVKAGANKEPRKSDGRTPLHEASFNGHELVVRTLLQFGCNQEIKDSDSCTARDLAEQRGYANITMLIDAMGERL